MSEVPDDVLVHSTAAVEVDPSAPIPVPTGARMVATDLDGTLLRNDQTIGALTRRAIHDAVDAGIHVTYVTGRPPRWLELAVADLGPSGHPAFAVCANGAIVLDFANDKVVSVRALEREALAGFAVRLREAVPGISFAVELLSAASGEAGVGALTHLGYEAAYDPPWKHLPGVVEGDLLGLLEKSDAVKVLALPAQGFDGDADTLLKLLTVLAGDAGFHITHSGTKDQIVEIMAPGADKGAGLSIVADRLGVAAPEAIAVGDMPNDLAMLRWVGTPYAVANAHPQVRALAHHVLPTNDDDGVGRLLGSLLGRG